MSIKHLRFPTHDEIRALEQAARRERAQTIARFFIAAVRGLAELIARAAALLSGRMRGPSTPARRAA